VVALLAVIVLAAHQAPAAEAPVVEPPDRPTDREGTFSVVIENDLFTNADRHYTNGIQLSYATPEGVTPDWLSSATDAIGLSEPGSQRRMTWSAGQKMFTPKDVSTPTPNPTDRPYAGFLYVNMGYASETRTTLDRLNLTLGVVGPASLADQTQKFVHRLTGSRTPRGWGTQLHDEPGVIVSYNRAWRELYAATPFGLAFDATPDAGISVGNVYTFASAGLTLRIGADLPQDYGPPRIAPPFQGTGHFTPTGRFGWYLFAGVQGRAVARDIFLDGNTTRDSPSVDKYPFVADIQAGLAITVNDIRIAYTHVTRTKEFHGQDGTDSYGSLSISTRF
jgi:hypothetical protein